jgi:cytoskeletal protein RodZ
MQLSRVALAAVFFVVGALLVIPMLMNSSSPSQAASSTPLPHVSASASKSSKASASPSRRPPASPTPTGHPSTPPAPSITPLVPLKVTIGAVRCPGRTVLVSVVNDGHQTEDYAITTDDSISVADRIPAGATRRSTLNIKEDHATTIAVTWHNVPVKSLDRTANCVHRTSARTLPRTGPDSGLILARVATGLAAMLTGIVIFWYGRQWPRRRDKMFDDTP